MGWVGILPTVKPTIVQICEEGIRIQPSTLHPKHVPRPVLMAFFGEYPPTFHGHVFW